MRPRIVQHSFGAIGSGGPIGALNRVMNSDMAKSYNFRHVPQLYAAGGINLPLIRRMAKQMHDFNPELAHIRGLGNEGFHGVAAARLARVPKILVSVHGSVADIVNGAGGVRRQIVAGCLEPATLRWATHVITVCDAALEKPRLAALGSKLLGSVPNGVDPVVVSSEARSSMRLSLSIADEDLVLITVARLSLDKGYFDLFEALAGIPAVLGARTHLLVVGEGPDRAPIYARGRNLVNVRVHLLGLRHDVTNLLAGSDIFVLPSLHENMSNALLEAMAVGRPVITTRVGGSTEVVSRGGGLLVPPGNPSALRGALIRMAGDLELRHRLGAEAQKVIRDNYTNQHMTERLASVYSMILEG